MNFFKVSKDNSDIFRDLAIIVFSLVIAVLLVKTGVLSSLIGSTKNISFFGSFFAGIFFTSIFTTIPATVVLGEISQTNPLLLTAVLGGAGATLGDLLIFRFVKDRLAEDVAHLLRSHTPKRLFHVFRLKFFKWFIAFLGALVIASPLPDELGLAMMGFSKVKTSVFIPLSFVCNTLGILVIGLVARAL